VLENEGRRRKKKKLVKKGLGPWHGRATTGTGCAKLLVILGSIFFIFFASYLDKYLQNKLKQHKTNKIKAIKLVGCLPRSACLKSLA